MSGDAVLAVVPPAGIDESAGCCVAAGFSLRAQLWHGYTRGCKAV